MNEENKNTNGLDQFFRSKLNPDLISDSDWNTPPDHLKQEMMDELFPEKEKNRFLPWIFLFATLFIFSIVTYRLYLAHDKMNSLEQELIQVKESLPNAGTVVDAEINTNENQENTELLGKPAESSIVNNSTEASNNRENTITESSSTTNSFNRSKSSNSSIIQSTRANSNIKEIQPVSNLLSTGTSSTSIVESESPLWSATESKQDKVQITINTIDSRYALLEESDNASIELDPVFNENPNFSKKAPSKYSVHLLSGVNGQKYTMTGGNVDQARYKGYENYQLGLESNIYVQKSLSDRWSLEGSLGIAKFKNNSVFKTEMEISDVNIAYDPVNGYELDGKTLVPSTLMENEMNLKNNLQENPSSFFPAPVKVVIDQEITTAALGLGAVYKLIDRPKWQSSLHLGMNYRVFLNFQEDRNLKLELGSDKYLHSYRLTSYSGPQSSLQANLSASFNYKWTDHIHITSRLGYEHGLSKLNNHEDKSIKTRWQVFNVQLGGAYYF